MTREEDQAFFDGHTNELAPYAVPHETWDGGMFIIPDEAGERLRHIAHQCPPFNWVDDLRTDRWFDIVDKLGKTSHDEPLEGPTAEWAELLLAFVRADRFCEGVVSGHAVALTRIANELRRRLIAERTKANGAQGTQNQ